MRVVSIFCRKRVSYQPNGMHSFFAVNLLSLMQELASPVVKNPKPHSVKAMLALAPNELALLI